MSGAADRLFAGLVWFQTRQTRRFLSRALVVFACTPDDAARVDVGLGPCQPRFGPRGGKLRPYALPSSQSYSTTVEHLTQLFSVLTSQPAKDGVMEMQRAGPGTMGRLTRYFVEALADVRSASLQAVEGGREAFQLENEIAERWLMRTRWPRSMRVGGLAMTIFNWSVEGAKAIETGLDVFWWEGPAAPEYVIAHGTSPESYEAYRKSKAR